MTPTPQRTVTLGAFAASLAVDTATGIADIVADVTDGPRRAVLCAGGKVDKQKGV